MENKSHALIAGLFTITLGIALALAALWLSRDTKVRVPYELATHASVSGLIAQSAVKYRGLDVGKVDYIHFDPKTPGQILVHISVEKGTPVTHSTFAQLGYQGVTGLAYVQLDDDGKNPVLLDSSETALARIEIQPGLFDKLSARGESILAQFEETARRLNTLLDPHNQKILTETLVSLNHAAGELGGLSGKLDPTLERLPQVAGEAQKTLAMVNVMAQDFSKLAARVQARDGTLDHVSASLDQLAATAGSINSGTVPRVNALADSAARSARALTRTMDVLGDNPQSLLFGNGAIPPGPGEAGFGGPK